MTKKESCCAVKFFHRFAKKSNPDIAINECSNWNKVYEKIDKFPKCRVIKAAEVNCLVMPYMHPIPEEDRLKWTEDSSIEKAFAISAAPCSWISISSGAISDYGRAESCFLIWAYSRRNVTRKSRRLGVKTQ
jgi:hypothetical protein